jgi:hypothetical protein
MPFDNLSNKHFDAAAKAAINTALTALEAAFAGKLANLTPEERQKYGSVNEQNKLIINKVRDYRNSQPALCSPDIDWTEFANDNDSRETLQNTIQRLQGLIDGIANAKVLHDFDSYQAALLDYEFAKYKSSTQTPGFETKVNELKQFFSGGASQAKSNDTVAAS